MHAASAQGGMHCRAGQAKRRHQFAAQVRGELLWARAKDLQGRREEMGGTRVSDAMCAGLWGASGNADLRWLWSWLLQQGALPLPTTRSRGLQVVRRHSLAQRGRPP